MNKTYSTSNDVLLRTLAPSNRGKVIKTLKVSEHMFAEKKTKAASISLLTD